MFLVLFSTYLLLGRLFMEIRNFHDKESVLQLEGEETTHLDNRERNFLTCIVGKSITKYQTLQNSK